jgi:hypothetical protein
MRYIYLLLNVVERIWRIDSETDENDVGVGVGKWSEAIVILLSCCIPKGQFNVLSIDFDIRDVVFEDGWDIDLTRIS